MWAFCGFGGSSWWLKTSHPAVSRNLQALLCQSKKQPLAAMLRGRLLLICTSLWLQAGASAGYDECLAHLTSPEQCTCLQWFALSRSRKVDKEDVKQGFRFFAKHAHPDKHQEDKGFWTKIFRFGLNCKDYLSNTDALQEYRRKISTIQSMADRHSWTGEKIRERIEELHLESGISSDGFKNEPLKPRFEKREGPAEKMHVFLDDYRSMSGKNLQKAKDEVHKNYASPRTDSHNRPSDRPARLFKASFWSDRWFCVWWHLWEVASAWSTRVLRCLVHDGYHWIYAGLDRCCPRQGLGDCGRTCGAFLKVEVGVLGLQGLGGFRAVFYSGLHFGSSPGQESFGCGGRRWRWRWAWECAGCPRAGLALFVECPAANPHSCCRCTRPWATWQPTHREWNPAEHC